MYTDTTHELREQIATEIGSLVLNQVQPSPAELLAILEERIGRRVGMELEEALRMVEEGKRFTQETRRYACSIRLSPDLADALRNGHSPDAATESSIDQLVRNSQTYRSSEAFREMVRFMGKFRKYAPYNNMLVKLQNPSCSFFARAEDWWSEFGRRLKEDAIPMIILAPKHPILPVFELDQTVGPPLPAKLEEFATFQGEFQTAWLEKMIRNAAKYRIRVDCKPLSSTHGGFATHDLSSADWKMRIVLHDGLSDSDKFGVLCHELAHVLLGHLGSDSDLWWPSRSNLSHATVEIEAESVAYLVTTRLGLTGSSAAYLSGHLQTDRIPQSVSLDLIAKVSGLVERMSRENLPKKKTKKDERTEES